MAQEITALDNAAALARVVNRLPGRGPVYVDGVACCRDCGEPIPAARLAALPDAERCAECQQDFEEQAGRPEGRPSP
jgi:phage/conjugal plasmid C-4 type zinc finger TraR family protein